jgi:triacylglycerol lipase
MATRWFSRFLFFFLGFCFSQSSAATEIGSTEKLALRDPIVLVHGASIGGRQLKIGPFWFGEYFQQIPDFLRELGNDVETPEIISDLPVAERAYLLKNFLAARFANRKVHIVAHSLGGLDARFLVSVLGSKQVLSITTIATPHRGSPLADWAIAERDSGGFFYWILKICGYDLKERRFLDDVGTLSMARDFNPKVVDRPEVPIFSVEAAGTLWTRSLSPIFYVPYYLGGLPKSSLPWLPTDGIVPLSSQAWGQVIDRVELDHLGEINHHLLRWGLEDRSKGLYRKVLENLVKQGFGK